MDYIQIFIVMAIAIIISFIAMHSWVFICDCIVGLFKKIFHIGKKKKVNWHTLDQKSEHIPENQITKAKKSITENEELY